MLNSNQGTVVLLNPTAPPRDIEHPMAERLPDMGGKTIGFLWNNKPNGDVLFGRLESLLREKYEIKDAIYGQKPTASVPVSKEVLDKMVDSVDAAVVGLGDWGSCTSWSIHDAVELEKRGIPTVTVCTHLFTKLGNVERRSLGMPELPLVIPQHPLGGLQVDAVTKKADQLLEHVIAGLVQS